MRVVTAAAAAARQVRATSLLDGRQRVNGHVESYQVDRSNAKSGKQIKDVITGYLDQVCITVRGQIVSYLM